MPSDRPRPIPKILHQTWKNEDLPEDFARWAETVRAQHPTWEYRLWTDEANRRLIADRFGWFLDTYDAYAHDIERADAARYFILLTYGGAYLDLDIECLRPIDDLLEHDAVNLGVLAGPTILDTIVANAFMAARPGHPFFGHVTRRLPEVIERDVTFADVFDNTGPDMLAREVRACSHLHRFHVIGLDRLCGTRVLRQNPLLRGASLEEVRSRRLLHLVHHDANSWNVQHAPPGRPPEGYMLFLDHDIPGHDLAYVEAQDDWLGAVRRACDAHPEAVGFNFNGYVKGPGTLAPSSPDSSWLRDGNRAWVCVKRQHVASTGGSVLVPRSGR